MIVHSLLQGQESAERIALLLSLTSISSTAIRAALYDHYVKGHPSQTVCFTYDITRQNFNRAMRKLNHVYSVTCAVHGIT